jgi:hypothetical protein
MLGFCYFFQCLLLEPPPTVLPLSPLPPPPLSDPPSELPCVRCTSTEPHSIKGRRRCPLTKPSKIFGTLWSLPMPVASHSRIR